MNDQEIEREIQAKGLTAPRYAGTAEAVIRMRPTTSSPAPCSPSVASPGERLYRHRRIRLCHPANFNEELGRRLRASMQAEDLALGGLSAASR